MHAPTGTTTGWGVTKPNGCIKRFCSERSARDNAHRYGGTVGIWSFIDVGPTTTKTTTTVTVTTTTGGTP